MKKNRKITLIDIVAIIVVIVVIFLGVITLVSNINKNKKLKELKTFSNTLISKAKDYMEDNVDKFSNFEDVGDITVITLSEMIENNYIDEDIINPTTKDLTDFYIKATIEEDKSISYEVIG